MQGFFQRHKSILVPGNYICFSVLGFWKMGYVGRNFFLWFLENEDLFYYNTFLTFHVILKCFKLIDIAQKDINPLSARNLMKIDYVALHAQRAQKTCWKYVAKKWYMILFAMWGNNRQPFRKIKSFCLKQVLVSSLTT